MGGYVVFDMHCHVDLINPMEKFCSDAQAHDISLLAVTTTPKAYDIELHMLRNYPSIHVALGLHPQLASERKHELSIFDKHISSSKFIGEVGLDFSKRFYHYKKDQLDTFEHIIQSCEHSKTISIHGVFADKQVLDILERYRTAEHNMCILHWYSGSLAQLDRAIELGCFFSINERMLFSPNGVRIIQRIPISQMLLESDAPFVEEIKTVIQLQKSLERTITGVERIKNKSVLNILEQTSKKVLGF